MEFVKTIITEFWNTTSDMSVYLLFGFFVAGIISIFISQEVVERHLGSRGLLSVLKASLFGVPLPLCSCGVIPVSVSLHKHGASKGATIAFLLSTPQTGVDSILVTLSLLGPVFAIFRPVVALITGVIGGSLVDVFGEKSNEKVQEPEKCHDACCCSHNKKMSSKLAAGMKFAFINLPRDIGRPMLAGLVVAALISALVPKDFFVEILGTGIFAMVVMMFLGIPMYVCATASVPIAAALMMKGLTPGAAMVFLMTGPATNAASLATIWKSLGSRTAIIYMLTVAGCALLAGITLDYLYAGFNSMDMTNHHHGMIMLPNIVRNFFAVVLLAILGYAALTKKKKAHAAD
ncbi:MAG: SO_0444 family Cu/Zn efflux transporter [Sedimentisphaerales bacterium]|nr:SO_0444 family Cu/Zn efflux transporter [Sedimentisphaerales bacterium]